jgi:hypothetical protein
MDFKHHNPKKELSSLSFSIGNRHRFFRVIEAAITNQNFSVLGLSFLEGFLNPSTIRSLISV